MMGVLETIALVALQFTWQGILVGGAALAAARLATHRLLPQDRYRLLFGTLLVLAALPVWNLAALLATPGLDHGRGLLHETGVNSLMPALPWIGATILGGVAVRLAMLSVRYLRTRRMRSGAGRAEPKLRDAYRAAQALLPGTRGAEIAVSRRLCAPQIVGWRHPRIMIPQAVVHDCTPGQLQALLLHELTHLERRDPWFNLLQSATEAIAFHPALLWVSRRIRQEREYCCDQRVVELGASPLEYGRALESLASIVPRETTLASAASGSPLVGRIEALARGVHRPRHRLPAFTMTVLLLAATVAFAVGFNPLPIRATPLPAPGGHAALHAPQDFAFPATPAGDAAREWFAAMADGTETVLLVFFEQRMYSGADVYDPSLDMANHRMILDDTGGLRPHSILRASAEEIVVLASGASGDWFRITLGVEPTAPYNISTLGIRKSAGPEAETAAIVSIEPALQQRIARAAASLLRDRYVYAEIGAEYATALERFAASVNGAVTAEALATGLTRQLQSIGSDKHLAILDPSKAGGVLDTADPEAGPQLEAVGEKPAGAEPELELELEPEARGAELELEPESPGAELELEPDAHGAELSHGVGTGFGVVEFLDGIAYIEISRFLYGPESIAEAESIMASAQNADAIVFDLRDNRGGDGEMADKLLAYLFAEPTHFMSSVRRGPDGGRVVRESWTGSNALSGTMSSIPVFVLTSRFTGSAAEAFSFGLQNAGRATLIGQTTAGAGHRVQYERLPGGFALGLPISAAVSPSTGEGFEGVGVVPDVVTDLAASTEALIELVRDRIR